MAAPSIARKNQIAKGMEAKMPEIAAPLSTSPPAQPCAVKFAIDQPGATTPMNTSSSKIASTVTKSSKAAAMPMPIQLSPMKIT
jgi:hypothetical protein